MTERFEDLNTFNCLNFTSVKISTQYLNWQMIRRTTSTSIIKPGRQGKQLPVYSTQQINHSVPYTFSHVLSNSQTHTHRTVAAMTMTTMMMMTKTTTVTKHRKLVM
jgi:hypothetical protein